MQQQITPILQKDKQLSNNFMPTNLTTSKKWTNSSKNKNYQNKNYQNYQKLPKWWQGEMENQKSPKSIKETEFINRNISTMKL